VLRSIAVPERPAAPLVPPPGSLLERVGDAAFRRGADLREFASVVVRAFRGTGDLVRGKHRTRVAALLEQAAIMGADAVPIVALMGALIGVVLAFQAAYQLEQFGAELFMAEVVSIGMVREFGAVITSVILSGRSGAAMAAELGTMAVNEELDALRSMGIDPARYLVSPRLLAMTLVTPLLGVVATAAGIAGGLGIAGLLGVPPRTVYHRMTESLVPNDFVLGLVKCLLFGWIITLVGCFMGLRTRGGAHNVGRNTTRSVVAQIMLIVITDSVVTTTWTLVHGHV
jgi:phospholipid/cholesterol/gamma-HCH transport system permease protein